MALSISQTFCVFVHYIKQGRAGTSSGFPVISTGSTDGDILVPFPACLVSFLSHVKWRTALI